MAEKIYLFALTKLQARVARSALNSACAGDWSDGDFCWKKHEFEAAEEAGTRLVHPACEVIGRNADLMIAAVKQTRDAE